MKSPNCNSSSPSSSSSPFPSPTSVIPSPTRGRLGSNPDSRLISNNNNNNNNSKPKPPKIRIIHIFAPEIIKTDATNFRELVQRLTGKPNHPRPPNRKSSTNNNKLPLPTQTPLLPPLTIECDDGEEARAGSQYSSGYIDGNNGDNSSSSLLFGGAGGFGFEFLGKLRY
ncbi:unnamed protein product [Linum trigynum]|uniref:VQ domain-containing protein n=1 Tax=Linum trigynum TaxID=586398 RepID=A0AAV2EN20_9ROSI